MVNFRMNGSIETIKKSGSEFWRSRARKDARNIHIGVAGAGETEIDDANDLVVVI